MTKAILTSNVMYDKIMNSYQDNSTSFNKAASRLSQAKKYEDFASLERDGLTNNFIRANSDANNINNYLRVNKLLYTRLEGLSDSLKDLMKETQDTMDIAASKSDYINQDQIYNDLFKSKLEALQNFLNKTDSYGRMFAGTNTDRPAVGDIVNNTNFIDGKVTDNYVLTNQTIINIKISSHQSVEANVSAGAKPFQHLIAGYHLMLNDDTFDQGRRYIEQAYDELNALRSEVNYRIDNVNKAITFNEEKLEVLQETNKLFQIDFPIASMELVEKQVQLQNTQAISVKLLQNQDYMVELFKNL